MLAYRATIRRVAGLAIVALLGGACATASPSPTSAPSSAVDDPAATVAIAAPYTLSPIDPSLDLTQDLGPGVAAGARFIDEGGVTGVGSLYVIDLSGASASDPAVTSAVEAAIRAVAHIDATTATPMSIAGRDIKAFVDYGPALVEIPAGPRLYFVKAADGARVKAMAEALIKANPFP